MLDLISVKNQRIRLVSCASAFLKFMLHQLNVVNVVLSVNCSYCFEKTFSEVFLSN